MRKKIVVILCIALVFSLLILIANIYSSNQKEKQRILEEERLYELLIQETEYYNNFFNTKKKIEIKKTIKCSDKFAFLTENGEVYARFPTYSSESRYYYELILSSELLGFEIKNLKELNKASLYSAFIVTSSEDKDYLIRFDNKPVKELDVVNSEVVVRIDSDSDLYVYVIDLRKKYGVDSFRSVEMGNFPYVGTIITKESELYTFGYAYMGSLGLGIESSLTPFLDIYEIENQLINPYKTVDNYGTIQGNVKQAYVKNDVEATASGKLSVLTIDGKFYVSGRYFSHNSYNMLFSPPAINIYSLYLKYVNEVEEIQGKIDYIVSDNFFDLLVTTDGKTYYFGIDPRVTYTEIEEEVGLYFYELMYNGSSINPKEIRCSNSLISDGCAILTDDELLVFGGQSFEKNGKLGSPIKVAKYSHEKLSNIPDTLKNFIFNNVLIEDNEWIALHEVHNAEPIRVQRTHTEYLEQRPARFNDNSIEDFVKKLNELGIIRR